MMRGSWVLWLELRCFVSCLLLQAWSPKTLAMRVFASKAVIFGTGRLSTMYFQLTDFGDSIARESSEFGPRTRM
jgi:hypothetical protein